MLGKRNTLQFHEDNQAMIQICKNGRSPTMRHLGRTHGIKLAYLHDSFTNGRFNLLYENTAAMAADIYTKAFTDGEKWKWASELINIVHKDRLRDLVLHTNLAAKEKQAATDQQLGIDYTTPHHTTTGGYPDNFAAVFATGLQGFRPVSPCPCTSGQ